MQIDFLLFNLRNHLIIFLQNSPQIAILSLFPLCHTLKETNKIGYSWKQALLSNPPTASGFNGFLTASQNCKATQGTEGRWQLQMVASYMEVDSPLGHWGWPSANQEGAGRLSSTEEDLHGWKLEKVVVALLRTQRSHLRLRRRDPKNRESHRVKIYSSIEKDQDIQGVSKDKGWFQTE